MSHTTPVLLVAAVILPLLPGVARATPCAEHIATIERRLNSEGVVAITGSTTGNQPVTEGSPKALPTPPAGQPSTGDAGPTPQRIAAARAAIERAKGFERNGNQTACDNAMSEAKQLIGSPP